MKGRVMIGVEDEDRPVVVLQPGQPRRRAPTTATPYLQSRAPDPQRDRDEHGEAAAPPQGRRAEQQSPAGSRCPWGVAPLGAGLDAVSASTPTGRLSSSQPDGFEAYVWVEQFRKWVWNV